MLTTADDILNNEWGMRLYMLHLHEKDVTRIKTLSAPRSVVYIGEGFNGIHYKFVIKPL